MGRQHRVTLVVSIAAIVAALSACSHAPTAAPVAPVADAAPASPAAQAWLANVNAMVQAADNAGRRTAIEQRLDTLDIRWRRSPFKSGSQQGENLMADVAGSASAPMLLIGAHFDRVEQGEGATDNASGSAIVLALAERFKRQPLKHHRVAIAFWDLEERGLLGSNAYVTGGGDKPALYVNFDVFGWGDTLWMMTPKVAHPLVAASQAATDAANIHLSAGDAYPPTDHLPFIKAGWPAVSYSLVGGDEITPILRSFAGLETQAAPKVMQVIHSDNDTPAQLDPAAAARGVDAVEDALRRWDAQAG